MLRGSRAAKTGATATDRLSPPIVGIGASAGGLEELKGFFGALPDDSGLAFIIAAPEQGDCSQIAAALAPHAILLTELSTGLELKRRVQTGWRP